MNIADISNSLEAQTIALRCAAEMAEVKHGGFCIILENIADKLEELGVCLDELEQTKEFQGDINIAKALHREIFS